MRCLGVTHHARRRRRGVAHHGSCNWGLLARDLFKVRGDFSFFKKAVLTPFLEKTRSFLIKFTTSDFI